MAAQKDHIRPIAGADALQASNQLAQVSEMVRRADRIALLQRSAAVYRAQCGANDQIAGLAAWKRSE